MRSPKVAAVELELVVVIPDLEEVVDVVAEVPGVLVAHVDPVDQGVNICWVLGQHCKGDLIQHYTVLIIYFALYMLW